MSFAKVPTALARDSSVSYGARHLWTILRTYSNPAGKRCFPGIVALCRDMGCESKTLHRFIRELVDAKCLTYISGRQSRATNSYTLRVVDDTPKMSASDTPEMSAQSITKNKRTKDPRGRNTVASDWSDGLGMQGGDGFRNAKGSPPEKELPSQTA